MATELEAIPQSSLIGTMRGSRCAFDKVRNAEATCAQPGSSEPATRRLTMLAELGAVTKKTKGTIFFVLLEGGIFPLLVFPF